MKYDLVAEFTPIGVFPSSVFLRVFKGNLLVSCLRPSLTEHRQGMEYLLALFDGERWRFPVKITFMNPGDLEDPNYWKPFGPTTLEGASICENFLSIIPSKITGFDVQRIRDLSVWPNIVADAPGLALTSGIMLS